MFIEVTDELGLVTILTTTPLFTEQDDDAEKRYSIGAFIIGLVLIHWLYHLAIQCFYIVRSFYWVYKGKQRWLFFR